MKRKTTRFDQLLVQMSEMIEMIENVENPTPKKIPPAAEAQLEILETAIPILQKHLQAMFKETKVDSEALREQIIESPQSDPETKEVLQKAKEIERHAYILQLAYSKAQKRAKSRKKTKKTQQMKERRKLFKPIGGDDKWIPL